MFVTKCDICKKEIKDYSKRVRVEAPVAFSNLAFCLNCGAPVIKFLEKNHLIEKPTK